MNLSFTKMNGAGNDFVLVDNRDGSRALTGDQIERLCDRHRGIGADGLLAVEPAQNGADFRMRYYNADGGEAEMCGNGARCFARFASKLLTARKDEVSFETEAGVISAQFFGDRVRIADERSAFASRTCGARREWASVGGAFSQYRRAARCRLRGRARGCGRCRRTAAALRYHEAFAPKRHEREFRQGARTGHIAIRTYERGVEGETLACGTGACAAAILHHLRTGEADRSRSRFAAETRLRSASRSPETDSTTSPSPARRTSFSTAALPFKICHSQVLTPPLSPRFAMEHSTAPRSES